MTEQIIKWSKLEISRDKYSKELDELKHRVEEYCKMELEYERYFKDNYKKYRYNEIMKPKKGYLELLNIMKENGFVDATISKVRSGIEECAFQNEIDEGAMKNKFRKETFDKGFENDDVIADKDLTPKGIAKDITVKGQEIQKKYVVAMEQVHDLSEGKLSKLRGLIHKIEGTLRGDSKYLANADKMIDALNSAVAEELLGTDRYQFKKVSELRNKEKIDDVFAVLNAMVSYGQMACMTAQILEWVLKIRSDRDKDFWNDIGNLGKSNNLKNSHH